MVSTLAAPKRDANDGRKSRVDIDIRRCTWMMDPSSPGTACARGHAKDQRPMPPRSQLRALNRGRIRSAESRRSPEARSSLSERAASDDHSAALTPLDIVMSPQNTPWRSAIDSGPVATTILDLSRTSYDKILVRHRCVTCTR